ncbi:hypothetical protein DFP93_104137 [Aneurinibacillus soli]|uniref:Uncharacterized protein n=1 Tax=Aneurinibacillus soli TaxID=1500254 RepID=A0A0U4WE56_9BACL|nr:hypothetical protein [Aneurinibacillus soli]PYE62488.1 hypothetical protein DFP93_104137 [Aneurinibacillus soli]BAU27051.1 hypothetical protein CB4_01220 [Aneurinibacillus soli]
MGRSLWIGVALLAVAMGMMRRKRRSRTWQMLGYGRRLMRSMDVAGMTNMSARYLKRAGRRAIRAMAR